MSNTATREAYGKALVELGRVNQDIVVLDADLSKSTKTAGFAKEFPDRFFDMGIAEADLMTTAAGLSTCGKIPFASTFAMFATGRAFEQIRNSICYPDLNVKIAATHAGITVGEDGASHQSVEDMSLMRSIPNMTVICPCDDVETNAAIKAVSIYKGPVYIRLGRLAVPTVNDPDNYNFEIGKAIKLKDGNDVSIFACGVMVNEAIKASEELEKNGISAEVINIHTIKPIDTESVINSARKTGAVITCEEHSIIGGLGSAVCEVLSENYPVPVKRIGIMDSFGESGKPAELMKEYGLTASNIVFAAKEVISRK
jgi:transketolase